MQTLETLFHEVTRNDHPSVNEADTIALFEILASATCSLDLCPTVERPTKYYFPPSNPTKEIKTQITPARSTSTCIKYGVTENEHEC